MSTPAHAEPRAVTALDAVRTFDCRGHPECPRPAATNRGPYAYLCDLHTAEKRAGQGGDHSVRVPRATAIPPNGFAAKAHELVAVGRRLDRAVHRYRPTKSELDAAMAAWREACAKLTAPEA